MNDIIHLSQAAQNTRLHDYILFNQSSGNVILILPILIPFRFLDVDADEENVSVMLLIQVFAFNQTLVISIHLFILLFCGLVFRECCWSFTVAWNLHAK